MSHGYTDRREVMKLRFGSERGAKIPGESLALVYTIHRREMNGLGKSNQPTAFSFSFWLHYPTYEFVVLRLEETC